MGVDGIPFIKRERMETINFLSGAFNILHEQNHNNNHNRERIRKGHSTGYCNCM